MQLSAAPVSTNAQYCVGERDSSVPEPVEYWGSKPICTSNVGPKIVSKSRPDPLGPSLKPQFVSGMNRAVQYGNGQSNRRRPNFSDQVRPSTEPLNSNISGCLKCFKDSNKLFSVNKRPLSRVLGFEVIAHTVVCRNFLFQFGHIPSSAFKRLRVPHHGADRQRMSS